MNDNLLFLPVLVQILLTCGLYLFLGKAKSSAIAQGEVAEDRRALYDDAWPESVIKINNSIRNQFEVPVLFYALVLVFWSTNVVNIYVHALAWIFVLSRLVHAYVHIGSNYVPLRRKVFTVGVLIVMILAVWAIISLLIVTS